MNEDYVMGKIGKFKFTGDATAAIAVDSSEKNLGSFRLMRTASSVGSFHLLEHL